MINEVDSLTIAWNFVRVAVWRILNLRGIYDDLYFYYTRIPGLELKTLRLMELSLETASLSDWINKGFYDALNKKYLESLVVIVFDPIQLCAIEEYSFSFTYRRGNDHNALTNAPNNSAPTVPDEMRSFSYEWINGFELFLQNLDPLPAQRSVLTKILYHDDETPADYQPPAFGASSQQALDYQWPRVTKELQFGKADFDFFKVATKVKYMPDV